MKKLRWSAAMGTTIMLGLTPMAVAQTPTETEAEKVGECPAVHLVLINGTSDTAPNIDPKSDHGFYASVATEALERANEGKISDKANGVQVPTTSAEPTPTAGSLWGSVEPTTSAAASANDFWTVETTTPSVISGAEVMESTPTTSIASQWPDSDTDTNEDDSTIQRIARTYITYPASAGGAYIPGIDAPPADSTSYAQSMETGVLNAKNVLDQIDESCPTTKVFISGYSQGAQVASTVLRDIGAGKGPIDPAKVAGGALLSDPTREENSPVIVGGGSTPAAVPGTSGQSVKSLGAFSASSPAVGGGIAVDRSASTGTGFGSLNSRVASFCVDGDLICAMPIDSPLPKLATSVAEEINVNDPIGSMRAVAESLGPAVVLGGVEAVADGISFGNGQFAINRATSTSNTLLGRIASEAGRTNRTQGEMEQRLTASLSQIGGMALAAGITVAKKTVTAENLAMIAAAGVAGPQAAVAVAAGKLAEASLDLLSPELVGGASRRVLDEVQAAGFNEQTLTTVATQAAQWNNQNAHMSYASAPVSADGRTAAELTTDWAVAAAADVVSGTSRALSDSAVQTTLGTGTAWNFDDSAASASLSQFLSEVQS